jgi:hypothetical protein
MIPQPSKTVEGWSHELMRVIDLGIQWISLLVVRSELGMGSIKYFNEVPLQENRGGLVLKHPNSRVVKLIWTVENGGMHVHKINDYPEVRGFDDINVKT